MPYAANGKISQDPFPGSIEITDAQYIQALNGMLEGWIVSIDNGFHVGPLEPETPSSPTYQGELSVLNSAYQSDIDVMNKAFSMAYLSDGASQDAKQTAIRAEYSSRKSKYTADVAALKIKYGV